jgi:Mycobacterial cell wall arabinan synthesis protein/Arabinosyltransferase concanavalin like domain/EmbC C-terminal domain
VLTPARTAPPAEPDAPAAQRDPRFRRWVLVFGVLATLAAVVFPFAPVAAPQVDYRWSAADGSAALPLMPYQPVALTATVDCGAMRDGALLLSTVPPRPDPAAEPLAGLRLIAAAGAVEVTSGGVELGRIPVARPCTVTVTSDPRATTVSVDDRVVVTRDGDVRPAVVGAFSDLDDGVTLALTADTRFQTRITPLKAAIAAVGVLALLGLLVALHRSDAARRRAPRRSWRPRLVDLAVTATLGVWWVIGAVTVDDGYIAGIIRSRGENGVIGNVYRWLNAPESPFSWFYDVLYPWSQVSAGTLWMRLPATLLGAVTWVLLSRYALPRLGVHRPWLAALAFLTWWVPLCLGLRPEPWVAAGLLGCWVLVERAIATRRLLPLVGGLLLAGATTALTPGGLIAFVPFLTPPVWRVLRARGDLHRWPLVAALVAAPASAVLLMVYDQSFGAVLESTRVRSLIGGGAPWYEEAERYAQLMTDSFQGSIGRRAAVLVTLLAAAAVLMAVRRGPKHRMVVTFLLALAVMTFTPTKWTQHFGDLAGVGAAVLVLGAGRARRTVGALAAAVVVGALVMAGLNNWPFVSAWFTPSFSTMPAQVLEIPVATLLLVVGAVAVVVGLVRRRVAPPVPLLAAVLVVALALQVLGLARVAVAHRDSYTLASDAVATLRGDPCGLQRTLSVETDPAAGLLAAAPAGSRGTAPPGPAADRPATGAAADRPSADVPVDIGGTTLPGFVVDRPVTTGWLPLRGDLVVVTTVGALRPGDDVRLDFGRETRTITETGDTRVIAPAGATAVRLVIDAGAGGTARVTLPRAPRLTPMEQVLPPGTRAILDWPVAFLFPCLVPEPLPPGIPTWRVAPPASDPAAGITYAPGFGGPFAGPRLLVTQQRLPTYLAGDPTRDAVRLYRWIPIMPLTTPQPVVTEHTVMGWTSDGHARVPGLDPVG